MSESLIRTQIENSLQVKSLKDLVKQQTDYPMLLIDASASMGHVMLNHKRRIDGLREVVTEILAGGPVTMICFGGEAYEPRFVDRVPEPMGGTPLHAAIRLAKQHGATRLVVISDGEPDLAEEAMNAAREFGGRIDVVFVGNPGEGGSFFLDQLAKLTGGTRFEGSLAETKQLTGKVIGLLMGDVEPQRAPIQGAGFTAVESDDVDDEDEDDDEDDDEDEDEDEEDEDDR